ncbi:J domain-containing protein [Naasia sp. SYSU D00057]|uniref:J domain-containing protein n=1 Tax=Naasia sp. SYSU D00057 TaxID=2817380 RepID=UPI001B3136B6|nr:J domain-containing protein [Naasia sp. SYSU D00057]
MSPADAAKLLGVDVGAGIQEIQHAYARQARLNHPDLLVDASDEERRSAGLRFAELHDARDALLAQKPVLPVEVLYEDRPSRRPAGPMRGPWSTVLVFLVLAMVVVFVVTMQDGFRMDMVENLRGTTIETPSP